MVNHKEAKNLVEHLEASRGINTPNEDLESISVELNYKDLNFLIELLRKC